MRRKLLLDEGELKRIRERMKACSWASSGYRRLRAQAEEVFIDDRPSPGMLDAVEAASLKMEKPAFPQQEGGYEYFVDIARGRSDGDWGVVFRDGGWPDGKFVPTGKRLEIGVSGQEGTEVYTGYGPSQFRGVNIPFVLVRRRGRNTVFRAVIKILA